MTCQDMPVQSCQEKKVCSMVDKPVEKEIMEKKSRDDEVDLRDLLQKRREERDLKDEQRDSRRRGGGSAEARLGRAAGRGRRGSRRESSERGRGGGRGECNALCTLI